MEWRTFRVGKTRWLVGAAFLGLAIAVLLGSTAADAATVRRFEATIFPSTGDGVTGQICGGTVSQFVKLTYTSSADSTQPTGSVGYTVSSSLSVVPPVGTPVASGGKTWISTLNGNEITLVAQSAGDRLNAGESVSVVAQISTTATSGTFPILVRGSQSNDPGSGNQFTGNDLAARVLQCQGQQRTQCQNGTAQATTQGAGFSATTSASGCENGTWLFTAAVLTPGACQGQDAKFQVLVSPTDPGATNTFSALVAKSLIGGNLSSIVVCKNDTPFAGATVTNAGTNVQITGTFSGDDPLVRGR